MSRPSCGQRVCACASSPYQHDRAICGCTPDATAYVDRRDRIVPDPGESLGGAVHPTAWYLATRGLSLVGPDRVIEPHVAIHTRLDIWYLNEGHLFLVEVDVAGETLRPVPL